MSSGQIQGVLIYSSQDKPNTQKVAECSHCAALQQKYLEEYASKPHEHLPRTNSSTKLLPWGPGAVALLELDPP